MYRWFLLPALKFIIPTIQLDTCVCARYVMRFTKHLSRPQLGSKKMASNWQFVIFDNATVNIWQHTCAFTTHEIRHLVVLLWICKYKQGRGLLIIAKDTLYYNEFIKEKIDYFLKSMTWRLCESANKIRESLQSGPIFCWVFFFNLMKHLF